MSRFRQYFLNLILAYQDGIPVPPAVSVLV